MLRVKIIPYFILKYIILHLQKIHVLHFTAQNKEITVRNNLMFTALLGARVCDYNFSNVLVYFLISYVKVKEKKIPEVSANIIFLQKCRQNTKFRLFVC